MLLHPEAAARYAPFLSLDSQKPPLPLSAPLLSPTPPPLALPVVYGVWSNRRRTTSSSTRAPTRKEEEANEEDGHDRYHHHDHPTDTRLTDPMVPSPLACLSMMMMMMALSSCVLGLLPFPYPIWILGDIFIRKYYTGNRPPPATTRTQDHHHRPPTAHPSCQAWLAG